MGTHRSGCHPLTAACSACYALHNKSVANSEVEPLEWQPLRLVPAEQASWVLRSANNGSMRSGYAAVSAGILAAPPGKILLFIYIVGE